MTTKATRHVLHWTAASKEDFKFAVAQDFVTELEQVMDRRGVSQRELASQLQITEGRVSQIINNPGNFTLGLMIRWAGVLGMKLSVVAYDDGDQDNSKGPIYSGVFRECWEALGKPSDRWELDDGLLRIRVGPPSMWDRDPGHHLRWPSK